MTTVLELQRLRRLSQRARSQVWIMVAALLLAAFATRVLLGDFTITIPDAVRILAGREVAVPGASYILLESKLPRAVVGVAAGMGLGMAGALFQTVLRNPLASPDVMGVTTGASAGAVSAVVLAGVSGWPVSLAAVVGALGVVVLLQWFGAGVVPRMILAGVGVAAGLSAYIQWVLTRADIYRAHDAMQWLTGSLSSATWPQIVVLLMVVGLAVLLAVVLSEHLHLLELGDDLAAGLGARVDRVRLCALCAGVVLVAACAAVVGPLMFVSLLAGPIARRLHRGRTVLLTSALVGAVMVVAADFVAAYAIPGTNLPVGVITGLVGGPFLVWLMVARSQGENR